MLAIHLSVTINKITMTLEIKLKRRQETNLKQQEKIFCGLVTHVYGRRGKKLKDGRHGPSSSKGLLVYEIRRREERGKEGVELQFSSLILSAILYLSDLLLHQSPHK